MPRHRTTSRNIAKILGRIREMCANDPDDAKWWADQINRVCDGAGDFFGTEGQNDPRGDQRE